MDITTQYNYKNSKIAITEHENNYSVIVRNESNDIIQSWENIKTLVHAASIAQEYIDDLQGE